MESCLRRAVAILVICVAAFAFGAATTSATAGAVGLGCAGQTAAIRFCEVRTENDRCPLAPATREQSSFLAWGSLQVNGVPYVTVDRARDREETPLQLQRVVYSVQMPARTFMTLQRLQGSSNLESVVFRTRARLSGVAVRYRSAGALASSRISFRVLVRRVGDGAVLATGLIDYRYDAGIARAPEGTDDSFSAVGRWYVNERRTQTETELGSYHGFCG